MLVSWLRLSKSRKKFFQKLAFSSVVVLGISLVSAAGSYPFWTPIYNFLEANEKAIKLVSYAAGPLLALLGFVLGTADKAELAESAELLGAQKQAAADAAVKARAAADSARAEAEKARKLRRELEGITKGAEQLWKLRDPRPFPSYGDWSDASTGARVVSIVNLKGGVGKTTIAANYAAYVSEVLRKRVLVVDLDYQGSLSSMLLETVGRTDTESQADKLFDPLANFLTVDVARIHLVPVAEDYPISLKQGWLIPAGSKLAQVENQLLLSWLLDNPDEVDVRYRLAHVLLNPNVRRQYDLIIFDLPPRMTLGSINAIVASNYFFVPTVLDGLSSEAVPLLVANVRELKKDLKLKVELSGVIGTLTQRHQRNDEEKRYLRLAAERAHKQWHDGREDTDAAATYALETSIPKRKHVADAAGNSLALLEADAGGNPIPAILTTLFADMSKRIGISGR
jgi:cellulose biosynthesis protein BcsQ